MRLLILGATGRTGHQLLMQALAAGHECTVLVRDPVRLAVADESVRVITGASTDGRAMDAAVPGQEAVLVALGNRRPRELFGTDLMARSIGGLVDAMQRHGVARVVLLSALGAGESAALAPSLLRLTFATVLRRIGRDKSAAEELLRRSELAWTIVYPPRLGDGPLAGRYRSGVDMRVSGLPTVSRADVAHLMLALLDDAGSCRASVTLSRPAR